MKNSTASNRKTGRMITKNLIILVVLVFVAILAMWAWFTSHTVDVADGIDVKCDVPDGIEIAVVAPGATPTDKDYTSSYITLNSDNYEFMKDLVMSEVTSDGKIFYKPALIQSNGVAYADTSANWDTAVANENYLSFDLYIRSKSTQKVSLTTKSKFTPFSDVLVDDPALGLVSGNKSTEGDYSKDCIIGATRLSIVDYNDDKDGELKLLWIPRPDIYFYGTGVDLDVPETGESSYDGLTYKHNYYEVTDTSKTLKTIDSSSKLDYFKTSVKNSDGEYALPGKTEILKLTKIGDDKYYTKCVRCNMWVDGEDSEDRLALVKGKFQIYLDLTIK